MTPKKTFIVIVFDINQPFFNSLIYQDLQQMYFQLTDYTLEIFTYSLFIDSVI